MAFISNFKSQVINLSPTEFTQLINPPLLIDVRFKLEYAMFHAPNVINLSLTRILIGSNSWMGRWFLPHWFKELPKDQPIALICLTAHCSPMAAKQLTKAGFTKIYNITGGMREWHRLGLPLESQQ